MSILEPMRDPYMAAHHVHLLVRCARALADDALSDMHTGDPCARRVEELCALMDAIEEACRRAKTLCEEVANAKATQAAGA